MITTKEGRVVVDSRQVDPQVLAELCKRAGISPEEIREGEPILFSLKLEPVDE